MDTRVAPKKSLFLLVMVTLMYSTICMETDVYVPAFPDMKLFFAATSDAIQWILTINFIGIFLGSLLLGPISDSYGRTIPLIIGLVLFTITSWACVFCSNFDLFLVFRFLQGLGAAAPMVITYAMILETYEADRVAQLCGGLNLFITGVMATAPILGSYLNIYYGWQANFMVIAIMASCSLLGSIFLKETLSQNQRQHFSVPEIIKNYGTVLTSFPYMGAAFICYIVFACLIVFISNLSLIFIDYLHISKNVYGFYQASCPGTFALMSLLSIWIIGYLGTNKTKHLGVALAAIGAVLLSLAATVAPNPILICVTMVLFTAGSTLAIPTYGTESANVFPEMRGISTGMSNALRHLVVAGIVAIGSYAFNGSIKPVASIIGIATIIVLGLAIKLATGYREQAIPSST